MAKPQSQSGDSRLKRSIREVPLIHHPATRMRRRAGNLWSDFETAGLTTIGQVIRLSPNKVRARCGNNRHFQDHLETSLLASGFHPGWMQPLGDGDLWLSQVLIPHAKKDGSATVEYGARMKLRAKGIDRRSQVREMSEPELFQVTGRDFVFFDAIIARCSTRAGESTMEDLLGNETLDKLPALRPKVAETLRDLHINTVGRVRLYSEYDYLHFFNLREKTVSNIKDALAEQRLTLVPAELTLGARLVALRSGGDIGIEMGGSGGGF